MKLKKLLKNILDLQEVTIYGINDVDFFIHITVSELVNLHLTDLGEMKVKWIFTDEPYSDVIFIGLKVV